MSMFSGKCDLFDSLYIKYGNEENIEKALKERKINIYPSGMMLTPLRIDTIKDIVPYYPYIVAIGSYSDGRSNMVLSRYSYIDTEEYSRVKGTFDRLMAAYKKCKRNKTEFTDEIIKMCLFADRKEFRSIADEIKEKGTKAKCPVIHYGIFEDLYRQNMKDEMKRYGYTDAEIQMFLYLNFYPHD